VYLIWGTALTGGGTGALDAEDGAGLNDKDAAHIITPTGTYIYTLDADSGLAESSPDVIKPDVNAGDKRWILVTIYNPLPFDVAYKTYLLKAK